MKNGLFILLILLSSCKANVVNYLNDKARFENFDSYSIVNVKINKRQIAPEATKLMSSIETYIKGQMETKRSYVPSNIDPDLIVRYELVSNTRSDLSSNNYRSNPIYNPNPVLNTRVIYESVILIEMYNGKTLVWQGSYDLTQSRKDERNEKSIKKAIDLIFTTYPYKAGQSQPDPTLTSYPKK
ncbi:MAG: DUF4136 domain-containing protein [Cyclobacteriaceae bacterium]